MATTLTIRAEDLKALVAQLAAAGVAFDVQHEAEVMPMGGLRILPPAT